jgi:phosphatidylinositol alpha-1,6-mannosyltransferase
VNSKKLLLITSEFPPQPGGIGNHAYHLAKHLQIENIEVTVLTDQRSKDGLEEIAFDAKQTFKIKRVARKAILTISYFIRITTAFKLLKHHDVVLLSGKFSLWTGGILSLFTSKKIIAVLHGSEIILNNKFLRKLTNWCLGRFQYTIAVSNYTKGLISDSLQNNCTVIFNGFEIATKGVLHKQKLEIINLITVGNVTKRKGQHNVINALPLLLQNFPKLKYHIVGIPTEKELLIDLAKLLNVMEAVAFHGMVSETNKIDLLNKASIFVMLSETTSIGDVEGFGIAILEANALGIPAIGAKSCGIEDAINDGMSGVLIDAQNPIQVLNAVKEINNSYIEYSENAKLWSNNFSWNEIIKQYLKVIEK